MRRQEHLPDGSRRTQKRKYDDNFLPVSQPYVGQWSVRIVLQSCKTACTCQPK
jgi:hypothetical protein